MGAMLLALARVGPLAWIGLPVPSRLARAAVAVALAAAVVPGLAGAADAAPLPVLLAHEVAVGLALGLVAAVPFRAAEAAGSLIDGMRTPRAGDRVPGTLRRGYLLAALAVFAAVDGPRRFADALGDSYRALPVAPAALPGGAAVTVEAVGRLVLVAVELAAPALAALLAADVLLGLVARAARSLAPAGARGPGAAARDLAGLAAIAATATALAAALAGGADRMLHDLAAAARALGG